MRSRRLNRHRANLMALADLVSAVVPDLLEAYREYIEVNEMPLAIEIVAERLVSAAEGSASHALATGLHDEAEHFAVDPHLVTHLRELRDSPRASSPPING